MPLHPGTGPAFQVHKAGLAGQNWSLVYRGSEAQARQVFLRQLQLYSVGRFRLLDPDGKVVQEGRVSPVFGGS